MAIRRTLQAELGIKRAEMIGEAILESILDCKLECPECGFITTVSEAEPDIDEDGSLGCPKCLLADKRVAMNDI